VGVPTGWPEVTRPATPATRLLAQTLGAAGVNIWLGLIGILTTPYLLLGLGSASYGVFAMVSMASSHLSNLEFGFGHATVRFLARAHGVGDRDGERTVLETSLAVFLAGGLVGGGVLLLSSRLLVESFFHIPAPLQESARQAFRLGGFILLCSFLASFFAAALQALGRLDWLNGSRAVFGTLSSAAAVAVVAAGGELERVFVAQTLIAVASCSLLAFLLTRIRGEWTRPRVDPKALREMATFGVFVFAGGIAYQWMINGPPVVLAAQVSSAELPPFSIPHTVLQKLILLVTSAGLAFYPYVSAHSAGSDRALLASVFESHVRLTILVMGPIASYLAAFGKPLLAAWVTPEFARDAWPCLGLLTSAAFVLAVSGPPADVARGLGRPSWVLVYTTFVAAVAVGTSLCLVPPLGAVGAALASLLSLLLITVPFLFIVARRLLALGTREMARAMLGPAVAVSAASLAFALLAVMLKGFVWALVAGLVVSGLYAAATFRFVLIEPERQVLLRFAGRP